MEGLLLDICWFLPVPLPLHLSVQTVIILPFKFAFASSLSLSASLCLCWPVPQRLHRTTVSSAPGSQLVVWQTSFPVGNLVNSSSLMVVQSTPADVLLLSRVPSVQKTSPEPKPQQPLDLICNHLQSQSCCHVILCA